MLKRALFTIMVALASAGLAEGQEAPNGPAQASSDTQNVLLTSDQRWRQYAKDAFLSPGPFFAMVMPAIGEHQRNQPEEYGRGWGAFGNRLGRRAAQYQLQTAIFHASAAALGTETGYRRCGCTGGAKRLGYALSRTLVSRTSSGASAPNLAYLGGVFGGGAIATETWYPDRYRATGEGLRAGTIQVGVNTAVNVIQEFGPELKRLFGRR